MTMQEANKVLNQFFERNGGSLNEDELAPGEAAKLLKRYFLNETRMTPKEKRFVLNPVEIRVGATSGA
jgi:hypothetical protein